MAPIGATVNCAGACAWAAVATMRASGSRPFSRALDSLVRTIAAAPSEIDDEVAAVIVPSLAKAGLSCGILSGRPRPGASSRVDDGLAGAALDRHRHDLVAEAAIVDRILGAAQALDRIIVHLAAGQLIFVGGALGEAAHRAAFLIGVLEAVEEHVVVGHVMADPRARAVLLEQIGRVGHRLHAAGDDHVGIAGADRLVAHDHRLHARAADLVDGGRLDRGREAGLDRRLPRRRLAEAGREHAAHVDAVDVVARDAGALDRRLDRGRAEIGGRCVGQRALHRAHRRARDRKDDGGVGQGGGHDCSSVASLRAQRSNPAGSPRRFAPRDDGQMLQCT